ncbi:MAG: hypothetical protein QOJ84_107 [Bradyrhizobium sp.]|jgi:hypothetical protein|nr:hypothetical protein [Bradyrhizobium sp.]
MERRHFLKLTFGFIAGASALAAGAEAAPLPPVTPEGQGLVPPRGEAEPAIVTQDDVDRLAPDQVRWRRRWGYRRRYWGYRRRRWRRRIWGYRRRWYRRRFWRRRYWRRRYW